MSMSADLRDRLAASGLPGKVFRDEATQGTPLPRTILLVVSDPRPSTYEGRQQVRETRVQIDIQAASRGQADAMAEQAIAAVEAGGTFGTTKFQRAFVDSARTYSDRQAATGTTFVTSLDLMVWHAPAA